MIFWSPRGSRRETAGGENAKELVRDRQEIKKSIDFVPISRREGVLALSFRTQLLCQDL